MKKIIVIGCPGSGKSTFSKSLHKITKIPLYHLDMLFWNEDKTTVEKYVFLDRLLKIIQNDEWIIDGNYASTMEYRLQACDTVFFLDLPTDMCLNGANARIGKKREDMPWIEQELDNEFKQYIIDFSKNEIPKIYSLLKKYNDKNVYIFKSHVDMQDFLNKL